MAYTQADLDNIRTLIAAGAGTVSIAGKTVSYRSLDELKRIEAEIEEELNNASSKKIIRTYKFVGRKGL